MSARPGEADTLGRRAALLSIVATLYFLVATVAAQVFGPPFDLYRDYLGDYAIGPRGWIYGSAFWAAFVATLALALALSRLAPRTAMSRIGLALMLLVAPTFPIEYFCPTDILAPGGAPTTTSGQIHLLVALIEWTLFPLSALLLTLALRGDPHWARGYRMLLGLAVLSIVLFAALWVVILVKAPFGGLADKLFFLTRNLWALLVSLMMLRAGEPKPSSSR